MAKALALFQYQVAGDYLKSFTVNHVNDETELFNELPFLYCVAVIKRDDEKVTPFGGFLIKTDLSKDDPQLTQYMYEAAQQLDKVSEILEYGSTIQITPTKYESRSIPDEEKCEKLVVGALYLYGWGGNA
jgi:hypothetical protein